MKLAIGLVLATSASAFVFVCGSDSPRQVWRLASGVHRRTAHVAAAIPTANERTTAIRFTTASVGYCVFPEANEMVWYSGFGGELVTWCYDGEEAIGGRLGYVLGGLEVWPDKHLQFPSSSLIHLLQKGTHSLQTALMSDDVDRIVLGLPKHAPDSEVAARMARKEFRSVDHAFDWAAYAARQNRCGSVPTLRHATILAGKENSSDRARRAAREVIDFLSWD
jgi:hypothetical protein